MAYTAGLKLMGGNEPLLNLDLVCTAPTTPAAGGPVICGKLAGVAVAAERSNGNTVVDIGPSVWTLSVKGVDGSGNAAIAAGDLVYYTDGDTPKLNVKTTGTAFGIALDPVDSGATTVIRVLIGRK